MTESTELPKFYTTNQVAEMFDVKSATVRDWIREGLIEAVKPNEGPWRISEVELRRFANRRLESRR